MNVQHHKPFLTFVAALFTSMSLVFGHGFEVVVFTKAAGYSHASRDEGANAIAALGVDHDFGVTITDDAQTLIDALPNTHVVVFMSTTGDVLTDTQQTIFQSWYQSGKGFVGVHAATDTEADWEWYVDMVGATFQSHPPGTHEATVKFLDQVHPITNVIDSSTNERVLEWVVTDEWYDFVASPRGNAHVLAVVDEETYTGGGHGDDHPIAWCQEFDGGRSAYLANGHPEEIFSNEIMLGLMSNAIEWAAGELGGDSGATVDSNYEKVILDDQVSRPMAIDVAEDGRVFLVERFGAVKVHDQSTGITSTIGTLDAYTGGEFGVLGIALAPDFSTTNNLYINWSPNPGSEIYNRVSRFTLDANGDLDLTSEVVIIQVYLNRPTETNNNGHHIGGCLRFDTNGNLYISVGDNTDAYNWSPRNEDNIGLDSRKGSPNTNDFRGKILRITPNVGGGPVAHPNYTIPEGNLFSVGTPLARPEIYVMGCRNNFRFCIDPYTDWLYFGDVGPDANNINSGAYGGPLGHDEFNQVKEAGWYGWPYYIADSKAYYDGNGDPWTVATMQADLADYFANSSGFAGSLAEAGDPTLLTEPEPAWIWYTDKSEDTLEQFSELGDINRSAMAGQVYAHQPGYNFPQYYDGSLFIMEFMRNLILEVKTKPDGSIHEITRFAPNITFSRPIDMQFGPDGAMYVIEWGSSWSSGTSSNTKLIKVQYTREQSTPIAVASTDVTEGALPLTVNFNSSESSDPDNTELTFAWDFDGDQVIDSTDENPSYTYTQAGVYNAILTVTDADGLFSRSTITINVGNNRPVLTMLEPTAYSFFDWGDTVNFEFTVEDPEDGTSAAGQITDADVLFETSLGHVDHLHNFGQYNQLSGEILIARDDSHGFDDDLSIIFDAIYTDAGATGTESLTGIARAGMYPKITMAQVFNGQSGVSIALTDDSLGGEVDIVDIDDGDYIYFSDRNLNGIEAIRLRAASDSGCTVEVREGSPTGNLIGEISVPAGDGSTYLDYTGALNGVTPGGQEIYFIFVNPSASDLIKLNWINFRGTGATVIAGRPSVESINFIATNQVQITFDQEMDYATLAMLSNYTFGDSVTVTQATPSSDQESVILTLDGAEENHYYNLTLSNIEDLAGDRIEDNTQFTVLNFVTAEPLFYLGINAAGPSYTDSEGNLYVTDTAQSNATLLVNFARNTSSAAAAVASDFAAADSGVSASAPVNIITSANPSNQAVTAEGLSGLSVSNTGGAGRYTTNKGNYVGNAIVDSYIYDGDAFGSTSDSQLTINGLDAIEDGDEIKLTLWGVGDTDDSDVTFQVVYNGSVVGTQTTDYEDSSSTSVQFTFDKVANQNSIIVNWGSGGTTTGGFNGFALTVWKEPSGFTFSSSRTASRELEIANTSDDLLYLSERYTSGTSDLSYAIDVPNGRYQVLLRFAESYATTTDQRLFNVQIEGGSDLFSNDLDLFEQAGKNVAFDYLSEEVTVSDSTLNIDFQDRGVNNPTVNAIGIFQIVGNSEELPDPSFASYLRDSGLLTSAASDLDEDGLSSLLEYALGGDDDTHNSNRQPYLSISGDDFSFTFERPSNLPDILYIVEASDSLNSNTWKAITTSQSVTTQVNGMERVSFTNLETAATAAGFTEDNCFFRLRVELTELSE
ncbi:ThuA domain-containing protein [Rubritalea spongiae]|uniref:ThuA domain-containing protein n=1 Tax=Rubritalea spongiae TaxID=430797 RepID=A0ABW5E8S3_9BACT